jgi:predicted enzyme related to lactoylglutathione lyase
MSNTILYCDRWQETVDFYQQILGLKLNFAKDEWFREFQLTETSTISVAAASYCSVKSSGGQGVTLSFQVADLAAHQKHFTENGIAATEIRAHGWRAPYFFVHDPEGNRIEYWTTHAAFRKSAATTDPASPIA